MTNTEDDLTDLFALEAKQVGETQKSSEEDTNGLAVEGSPVVALEATEDPPADAQLVESDAETDQTQATTAPIDQRLATGEHFENRWVAFRDPLLQAYEVWIGSTTTLKTRFAVKYPPPLPDLDEYLVRAVREVRERLVSIAEGQCRANGSVVEISTSEIDEQLGAIGGNCERGSLIEGVRAFSPRVLWKWLTDTYIDNQAAASALASKQLAKKLVSALRIDEHVKPDLSGKGALTLSLQFRRYGLHTDANTAQDALLALSDYFAAISEHDTMVDLKCLYYKLIDYHKYESVLEPGSIHRCGQVTLRMFKAKASFVFSPEHSTKLLEFLSLHA